jgi:hypothetical protein
MLTLPKEEIEKLSKLQEEKEAAEVKEKREAWEKRMRDRQIHSTDLNSVPMSQPEPVSNGTTKLITVIRSGFAYLIMAQDEQSGLPISYRVRRAGSGRPDESFPVDGIGQYPAFEKAFAAFKALASGGLGSISPMS